MADLRGQVAEALGNVNGALDWYDKAIKMAEAQRDMATSARSFSDLKGNYRLYERAIDLCVKTKRYEKAFEYLSRAKSGKMRDLFRFSPVTFNDKQMQEQVDHIRQLKRTSRLEFHCKTNATRRQRSACKSRWMRPSILTMNSWRS